MTPAHVLVDTSALVRLLRHGSLRGQWQAQITAGIVAVCPIVELELLYTARSKADREEYLELLGAAFTCMAMPEPVFRRATEVQGALTARGTHRSAGAVDLLVAASAELHGIALLHYDRDFDEIAKVTGQPMVWVAPPGTID